VQENLAMPLQISLREFTTSWCGFCATARHFLHTSSATVQNAEITHSMLIFMTVTLNDGDSRKSRHDQNQ